MIARGSDGLSHFANFVRTALLPNAPDAFVATDVRLTAMMLDLLAEDFDRAADIFVKERAAIIAFFEQARPFMDGDLAARLDSSLARSLGDLRISSLSEGSDSDLRLLILVHTAIEEAVDRGESWAADLNSAAWRVIDAHVASRAYRTKA